MEEWLKVLIAYLIGVVVGFVLTKLGERIL